jgi:CspA family cold shock protein
MTTLTGTVKYFDPIRQFGFIKPDDGSDDVYVHGAAVGHARLHDVMQQGLRVAFDTTTDRRGTGCKALNLKLID